MTTAQDIIDYYILAAAFITGFKLRDEEAFNPENTSVNILYALCCAAIWPIWLICKSKPK